MNLIALISHITSHVLNRNSPFKAMIRLLRWQLASRILRNPIALPFINETHLVTELGMSGSTQNWYCGLHEVNEMGFVLHMLRSGDLFMDVGSNAGSYTVLAAGAVGSDVIAIEPVPATFTKLQRNILYNDLSNKVDARCVGLSSEAGALSFTSELGPMNRVVLNAEGLPTISVPVVTMDDLCKDRVPQIIKIDVEGHEAAVLQGGVATLADERVEAVLMETNASGEKFGIFDQDLVEIMLGQGFATCSYDAINRKLSPAARGSSNTLFVRNIESAQAKCITSARYNLVNGDI